LDDILNRVPTKSAPYVGGSAFVHKAGLHASAILKDPTTYEHMDPALVGNERVVPMSNQAGQSNLRARLQAVGITLEKGDPHLSEILDAVKEREDQGYAYDSAEASFELVARGILGTLPNYFDVERYRVISERRRNAKGRIVVESEAMVTVRYPDGVEKTSFFKNEHPQEMSDDGPVNAIWLALQADLGPYQASIEPVKLTDFKVRITQGGIEAVTRVIIDFTDGEKRWSTVGVSSNIVDASFAALLDALVWKLLDDGVRPA
jgi:2-isopropylmalate synthase